MIFRLACLFKALEFNKIMDFDPLSATCILGEGEKGNEVNINIVNSNLYPLI
jgi:hypothetical protein